MYVAKDGYKKIIRQVALELELTYHELSSQIPTKEARKMIELGVKFACCQIRDITGYCRGKIADDLTSEVGKNDKQRDLQIKTLLQ